MGIQYVFAAYCPAVLINSGLEVLYVLARTSAVCGAGWGHVPIPKWKSSIDP
jgi:hypothetical protein